MYQALRQTDAYGAQTSAVMYSLIETAKENGIKPYDYIVWLLKAAPELDLGTHPERAELLLPMCFQQAIVMDV